MTTATADHLRRLPKVELHCHVEGAARAATIAELAAKNGVALPVADPAELFRFTDLNQFLGIYEVVCRSLVTADDFHRIAYEACEDGVVAGVRYREMFFSPGFALKLGVPIETIWEGLSAGVRDANADLDITCRLILDFDKPSGPAHAEEMVAFAAGLRPGAAARHRRRLGGAGHRPRRLRRRLLGRREGRAPPHAARRRGRAGREHPDRGGGAGRGAHRPRLPAPRRSRAHRPRRRPRHPGHGLPDLEPGDRPRHRRRGRAPLRAAAQPRGAHHPQQRRPRDDDLGPRRRVRRRRRRLRLRPRDDGAAGPRRPRRVVGPGRREGGAPHPPAHRVRRAAAPPRGWPPGGDGDG